MFFGKTIFLFRLSCRVDENEDGVDRREWVLATQLHSHNASTPVPYFVLGLSKASCNLTSRLINFLIWLLEFGVSLVMVSPIIKVTLPSRKGFYIYLTICPPCVFGSPLSLRSHWTQPTYTTFNNGIVQKKGSPTLDEFLLHAAHRDIGQWPLDPSAQLSMQGRVWYWKLMSLFLQRR